MAPSAHFSHAGMFWMAGVALALVLTLFVRGTSRGHKVAI
jgi:hypothetical protein